jgi:glycosyltransferase involved in cell wall biosynthesis
MTKRALAIAYYFPPMGMGGVTRPLHLFRKLPDFGWDCHVLTIKPVVYRAHEPELLEGLETRKIHRAGSRDPQRLLYLLGLRRAGAATINRTRGLSRKFFPDSKVGWVKPAIKLGRILCDNYRYDCLVSTAPPISAHLVARALQRDFGIPWIADFRDYWTAYKVEDSFDDPRTIERGKTLLREITGQASAVTTVNTSILEYLGGGEMIRNGFDPQVAEGWRRPPDSERFTIGLLGHQLGHMEIDSLVEVLKEMQSRCNGILERLRLIHVGQAEPNWIAGKLDAAKLKIPFQSHGRMSRRRTIDILSCAHLFHFGLLTREGEDFLPGKTFDLLASGRPIIVSAPDGGEVTKVLSGSGRAHIIYRGKLASTADYVESLIRASETGEYAFHPLSEYALRFTTDEMARRFVELMERLS